MHYLDDISPKIRNAIFECQEMFKTDIFILNKLKTLGKKKKLFIRKMSTIWEVPNY